jgi:hypothetical protein
MGTESGLRGDEEEAERIVLAYEDEVIHDSVIDQEGSLALFEHDPVLWLRGAIGLETQRGASFVTDGELAARLSEGNFLEWDPRIAVAVKTHLQNKGYVDLSGANSADQTI